MIRGVDEIQSSVDRVLQSAAFRNSPSSRRLLKYLADHSVAGDADQLKEYTVGVDAFSKPEGYDPRQDSTVRIQMGRLRQKLSEYYQDEGKTDAVVVDIPKGRFAVTCESRFTTLPDPPPLDPPPAEPLPPAPNRWRTAAAVLATACALLAAAVIYLAVRTPTRPSPNAVPWSADLDQLWQPFLSSGRPLRIVIGNPLFLQFENKALYRDLSIETPDGLQNSTTVAAIGKALNSHENRPVHYYAAVGDVYAAFFLGQRLGPREPAISVVRSSQLQWQQLADANALFLGPPRFFGEKMGSLPIPLEITQAADGFHVAHPAAGEARVYSFREPPGFLAEDGEAHVLITRAPGPAGATDVLSFESNSTFGRMGAIEAFTDPAFARTLVARMSRVPRYFQVLLKVKYKSGVPTDTTYVLHRELRRSN